MFHCHVQMMSHLGVHEIEFVINAAKSLSNGRGVGNHTYSTLNACKIASWNNCGWLVVDTALKTGGAPINKLNCPFSLDGGDGCIDILGHNISAVHETAGHVLSMTGIALGHHASGLKDGVGNLSHGELLMVSLLCGDDWCV